MSSESKSHNLLGLWVEVHLPSTFEGELHDIQPLNPVLNLVTSLNQPQVDSVRYVVLQEIDPNILLPSKIPVYLSCVYSEVILQLLFFL